MFPHIGSLPFPKYQEDLKNIYDGLSVLENVSQLAPLISIFAPDIGGKLKHLQLLSVVFKVIKESLMTVVDGELSSEDLAAIIAAGKSIPEVQKVVEKLPIEEITPHVLAIIAIIRTRKSEQEVEAAL